MDIQLVCAAVEVACNVNCECKVTTPVECSIVSVYEYGGFVIDGTKVE